MTGPLARGLAVESTQEGTMPATTLFLRSQYLVGIALVLAVAAAAADLSAPSATTPDVSLISTTTPGPPQSPPVPLPPNDRGYVRVETNSGSTGCSINSELVACQTAANNWPANPGGQHYHTVSVNVTGEFHWVEADLGALDGRVTLDKQTYSAQGWTIVVTSDTTTFTNGGSGHGMSVSDQSVRPF